MNHNIIMNLVCQHLNINPANLNDKHKENFQAKHIAIYLTRKHTKLKLKDLKDIFQCSHSEIIRATNITKTQHHLIAENILKPENFI